MTPRDSFVAAMKGIRWKSGGRGLDLSTEIRQASEAFADADTRLTETHSAERAAEIYADNRA